MCKTFHYLQGARCDYKAAPSQAAHNLVGMNDSKTQDENFC